MTEDPMESDQADEVAEIPSTVYAFWPDREPPLEEEVRLALERSFPGTHVIEELDPEGDMVWGHVVRLPEHEAEFVIWVEERGEMSDDIIQETVPDEDERRAATAARWMVGVETVLDPRQALGDFQTQLRILDAVSIPGLPAVYDDNALVVRSGKHVRELARSNVPPRAATLYAIHEMEGRTGIWLHTHGLVRLGIPEFELMGLSASDVREGYDLIDALVDVIYGGGELDESGVISIGEEMDVRLVSVDEALEVVSGDVRTTRTEHQLEDDEHKGPRVAILAKERNEPPYELLDRLKQDAVLFKSNEESDRQRRLAIERFGVFGQLFAIRRQEGWRFHAKLAFDRESEPAVPEHLWFEIRELRPGALRGVCLNEPLEGLPIHVGDENWYSLEKLTDWIVVAPQGIYDPEAAAVLLADA